MSEICVWDLLIFANPVTSIIKYKILYNLNRVMDLATLQGTDGWTLHTFLQMTNTNWNYHNYCAHGGSKNSTLSTDTSGRVWQGKSFMN